MKNSRKQRHPAALLLAVAFILVLLPTATQAAADYTGHWAASSIETAVKNGWFTDGGSIRPNDSITRAEFVTMVNRMMGFDGTADLSAFSDIQPSDWYYSAFSIAVAQGYIQGSDGKLKPTDNITRIEAVTIFARISGLDTSTDNSAYLSGVRDAGGIPAWARPYAGAAIKSGLIAGANGNFNGGNNITRAETAVLLDRLFNDIKIYGFAGTYSGNANAVIIAASGVTLKNASIVGDLIIAKSVGDGEVILSNVKVSGNLDVQGGGMNSVYLEKCEIASIVVTKDEVRVVFQDGTTTTYANVAGVNSAIVIGNGAKVDNIIVESDAQGSNIVIENGARVENVEVSAPSTSLSVESGVTVSNLTVTENASGSSVSLDNGATVTTASVAAESTSVNLSSGARITTLNVTSTGQNASVALEQGARIGTVNIAAAGSEISGNGNIGTANINAPDVVIEQKPGNTSVGNGVTAIVDGSNVTGSGNSQGGNSQGENENKSVKVTGVSLSQSLLTLTVGDTTTLTAAVAPANATSKNVTWRSSNSAVVTVSGGVVTAVNAGSAVITVATADGNRTATCNVTVSVPEQWVVVLDSYIPNNYSYEAKVKALCEDGTTRVYALDNIMYINSGVWTSAILRVGPNNNRIEVVKASPHSPYVLNYICEGKGTVNTGVNLFRAKISTDNRSVTLFEPTTTEAALGNPGIYAYRTGDESITINNTAPAVARILNNTPFFVVSSRGVAAGNSARVGVYTGRNLPTFAAGAVQDARMVSADGTQGSNLSLAAALLLTDTIPVDNYKNSNFGLVVSSPKVYYGGTSGHYYFTVEIFTGTETQEFRAVDSLTSKSPAEYSEYDILSPSNVALSSVGNLGIVKGNVVEYALNAEGKIGSIVTINKWNNSNRPTGLSQGDVLNKNGVYEGYYVIGATGGISWLYTNNNSTPYYIVPQEHDEVEFYSMNGTVGVARTTWVNAPLNNARNAKILIVDGVVLCVWIDSTNAGWDASMSTITGGVISPINYAIVVDEPTVLYDSDFGKYYANLKLFNGIETKVYNTVLGLRATSVPSADYDIYDINTVSDGLALVPEINLNVRKNDIVVFCTSTGGEINALVRIEPYGDPPDDTTGDGLYKGYYVLGNTGWVTFYGDRHGEIGVMAQDAGAEFYNMNGEVGTQVAAWPAASANSAKYARILVVDGRVVRAWIDITNAGWDANAAGAAAGSSE